MSWSTQRSGSVTEHGARAGGLGPRALVAGLAAPTSPQATQRAASPPRLRRARRVSLLRSSETLENSEACHECLESLMSDADVFTDRLGDATRSRIGIVRKVPNRTL